FAPTPRARDNLLREGVDPATVHLVGNTVIDALFHARDHLVSRLPPDPALDAVPARPRRLVLVTAHRRESFGPDLRAITQGRRRPPRAPHRGGAAARLRMTGTRAHVVLPAYNEEAAIGRVLDRIEQVLDAAGIGHTVLVVDDGSRDATARIVEERAARRAAVR